MLIAAMVLSGLFVLFVVYFIVVVFSPWIREYRQPVPAVPSQASVEHTESLQFRDVRFVVSGVDLAGRLYLPTEGLVGQDSGMAWDMMQLTGASLGGSCSKSQ